MSRITKRIVQSLRRLQTKAIQKSLNKNVSVSNESVYFYTFHKCASSLFSSYILKNIEGLCHIDYAEQIYKGENVDNVIFEKEGFIYGPIRLSVSPNYSVYEKLVKPASTNDFIKNKIAIFLVRDPRDILVSDYYSSGYTHGFSPVEEIQKAQKQRRNQVQSQSVDEFVLDNSSKVLSDFKTVDKLSKACNQGIILKYEDMIDNWDYFTKGLTKYIEIKEKVLTEIYKRSRPREKEFKMSHRRSGKPGNFRSNLNTSTVTFLNTKFEAVLEQFQYDL